MAEYNILKLLDDRGVKYNSAGVHNVKIKCFSGMHEDKKPSLLINTTSGEYHCFVCQVKGNIVSYFLDNKEISYAETIHYQKTNYATKDSKSEEEIFNDLKKKLSRKKEIVYLVVEVPPTKKISYNYYLNSRGFTNVDIEKWDMQVINDPNDPYNGWIYVPVYFNNVLRTYFLRNTQGKHKIYGYKFNKLTQKNEGYPRRDILFGYDQIKNFDDPVYIFEGIFDAIWFMKTNKQALALLGNVITTEQIGHLKKFKKVVLALDNDEASYNIVKSALGLLSANIEIYVWQPPKGKKDANVCTMRELIEQTYKELPLRDFMLTPQYKEWSLRDAATKSKFRNS